MYKNNFDKNTKSSIYCICNTVHKTKPIHFLNRIDCFADLGDERTGYKRERVTCCMHSAAYHIPNMVERYKNIKQFSGQGHHTNYTEINTFISTLRNMDIDFKFQIYYIFRCRKEQ
jgi:hypothetical protein